MGELYLTGPNVGSGYINDTIQTKKTFLEKVRIKKNLQDIKQEICLLKSKTKNSISKAEKTHKSKLWDIELN